ncbi:MAG: type I-E CRISPR-associated protein Cse1/CasA, partial [Proteobacteria bacterium]|nr:type I-E CRISPR-associated protein Cse1/CasA [Pseudomonadota bacterium]
IRLFMERQNEQDICDLCGMSERTMVSHFMAKNLGVNYEGPWIHPLSPYFFGTDGTPSAIHPQPGGIGYRHWLGLVQTSENNKGKRQPARVVENFIDNLRSDLRLWAFGYDMDSMKARCWYDSTMPLVLVDFAIRKYFEFYTAALVNSAKYVSRQTRTQIKRAFFKPRTDVKGDLSFVESRFWQETEGDFFDYLSKLRDALNRSDDVVPILKGWHKRLASMAETIFNDVSQTGAFDAADPKRIALAWRDLQKNIYSKKLREQLGLPAKK